MRWFLGGTALAALIVGCGSGTEPAPPHLALIHVHFSRDTVAANDTVQASVAGLDQFSSPFTPATLTWQSSNPAVATVGATGRVLGVSIGATSITATAEGGVTESRVLVVSGTLHTQPVTADEVWTLAGSPHWVRGHIPVGSPAGAVLTLEAGTTVRFFQDAGLDFGAAGPGRLVADGATQPITLRLNVDVGPNWLGLTFQGPGQSVMRNLVMWGCGGYADPWQRPPCVVLKDVGGVAPPTLLVDDLSISNSGTSGISLEGGARFAAGSQRLSISGIGGSIATIPLAAVASFPVGGAFGGNSDNTIHVIGDSLSDSLTLPRLGAGWRFTNGLIVAGPSAPVLTIPDSTRVVQQGAIIVGRGAPGGIQVGSTTGTVIIESPDQYSAPGIYLESEALPSAFRRTVFRRCAWSITVNGNGQTGPEILADSVVIENADGAGVKLTQGGRFAPGSRLIKITGTTGVPMYVSPGAIHTIPAGVYTGNQYDAIVLWGTEVKESETWPNLGIPYATGEGLFIQGAQNPVLTLEPGVVLRTREVGQIWVGVAAPGGLRAMGTAAAPVRITGEAAPSSSGFWRGIYIGPQADPSTLLFYATVENAGAFDGAVGAAIHINHDLGEIVKNTVIRWSSGCGIARESGTWTTDFTAPHLANQFDNVAGAAQCGP